MREATSGLRAQVLQPLRPSGVVIVASGKDLTEPTKVAPITGRNQGWQNLCWNFYDIIPPYHYGVDWVGNLLSKAKLVVLENGAETTNQSALDGLASFFGGVDQQGEFLRQAGIHMTVPGELYIVSYDDEDGDECWDVVASTEIRRDGLNQWKITGREIVPTFVMRCWRPHPRKGNIADSPSRALLNTLGEIDMLYKYVNAQGDSRLTGNGILFLPSQMSFPSVPQTNADGTVTMVPGDVSSFLKQIYDTAVVAKKNPESAAARLPILAQADGEWLDKITHKTFWSEFDEQVPNLRKEAVTTLAQGMDMPPEVLLGTAGINHWNAWQVEEASIKAHTEPLLALIVASLTSGYLRPYLVGGGMDAETAKTFTLGADTSAMRLQPNRSKEAIELYDRGELSAAAMLKENGFDPSEKMELPELKMWLAKQIASTSGGTTPDQIAAASRIIGLTLPDGIAVRETITDSLDKPNEKPNNNTPSLEDHPPAKGAPPSGPPSRAAIESRAALLMAAAEPIVYRALERAGNKMKTRFKERPADVAATELYRFIALTPEDVTAVLEGAWDGVARSTTTLGVEAGRLTTALDGYVRMLFFTHAEHDMVVLRQYLSQAASEE